MARVAPVQTPELRPSLQPNQQAKAADPFAMLLDNVSDKRVSAPEPRRKPEPSENSPRVGAAEKPERPQPKQEMRQTTAKNKDAGKVAKDTCEPKEEKVSSGAEENTDTTSVQQADATDVNNAAVVMTETPVVAAEVKLSLDVNVDTAEEQAGGEIQAMDEGVSPVADVSADASAEIETAAPVQQTSQQATPEAAVAAPVANAEVIADAQPEIPVAAAAVTAAASTETKQNLKAAASVETETIVTAEADAKPSADGVKKEEPVQAQKPAVSNHAEVREAVIAEKGEQTAQVKNQNTHEAAAQAKEHASAKPLEQVPAQSQVENSTPRQQATPQTMPVLPEPVRALAGSINPVNLRAANEGATNAVQANAGALGVEIASRAKDGAKRFDIRLDPPELGRVEVRLEVDSNGKVSTRLIVERPETLDLLQRDARNLERALQSAGLQTDEGGMQFSLQDQGQNGLADANSDRGFERRGDFFASEIDGAEPASPAMDRYAQSIIARGGVDIRI